MKRWSADINPRERVGIRSLPPPLRADFLSIHQPTLRPQNRAAVALCRASSSSFPPFFAHSPLRVDRTAYPFEKKKSRKRRGERERERERERSKGKRGSLSSSCPLLAPFLRLRALRSPPSPLLGNDPVPPRPGWRRVLVHPSSLSL